MISKVEAHRITIRKVARSPGVVYSVQYNLYLRNGSNMISHLLLRKAVARWHLILMLICLSFAVTGTVQGSYKPGRLCENAKPGHVEELPQIIHDWVVILCTDSGQALAPMVKDKIVIWKNYNSQAPFLLQAYPFGKILPDGINKEDIRFTRFAASEMQENQKFKTLKMWEKGFGQPPTDDITQVIQLDAQS
ncbi:MAG: hypothetical protein V7727_21690, partial [Sneathiella sp.]